MCVWIVYLPSSSAASCRKVEGWLWLVIWVPKFHRFGSYLSLMQSWDDILGFHPIIIRNDWDRRHADTTFIDFQRITSNKKMTNQSMRHALFLRNSNDPPLIIDNITDNNVDSRYFIGISLMIVSPSETGKTPSRKIHGCKFEWVTTIEQLWGSTKQPKQTSFHKTRMMKGECEESNQNHPRLTSYSCCVGRETKRCRMR